MNIKNPDDHREFSRVRTHIHTKVLAKGEEITARDTEDISMKGLFVRSETPVPVGTECEIHLLLEDLEPPLDIELKGRVQRMTDDGMGILFTEVSLDAYEHLHNIVLLNSHEPDRVEREIKNNMGLKKKN
ncbi:MAG: hypothetical protein GWM98_25675 [Nitrospinaceae bacterium]|nr:PilZ domain-containing protein [Nitrospinaceae bacterium]NIR57244.1 PilZ domain-containing protein [Nitrospinaceae bacterium]NIS87692.1 PilZ domain-containing protein [Nitrospinaceae bacterium]NIT84558.1 PilZ domain-containing protein [Nitrospinaceae bacterium]NIU46744.1 PilZ domain-containing protein [Nitrospinaceae bacterium]